MTKTKTKTKTTISDIVNATGVSKTTVSRYLNGKYEYMSEETRERIAQAIAQLNYQPSIAAQSLRSRKSHMIGVILSGFGGQDFMQELSAICTVLEQNGYSPIILQGNDDPRGEMNALTRCISQRVDGILLHPSSPNLPAYESIVETEGIPIVLVGRNIPGWKYDSVYINQRDIVMRAIDRLSEQGFTKIAFMTKTRLPIMSNSVVRRAAFLDYQRSRIGPLADRLVVDLERTADGRFVSLRNAIPKYLQQYPDERKAVIVSGSDLMWEFLVTIRELNYHIPEDFGVCGFNAWNWLQLVNESIMIINRPLQKLGQVAAELILQRIQKEDLSDPQTILLPASFHDEKQNL